MKSGGPIVGIIAPASKVPKVPLQIGVERLESEGFEVRVHPQCLKSHTFFAGSDEDRANAFLDFAYDPDISVVWAARGGYGGVRLLPYLDRATRERGIPPRKLFAGYSDSTLLLEFVKTRWKWATLHSVMPADTSFRTLSTSEWKSTIAWVKQTEVKNPWGATRLKFWGGAPESEVVGEVTGGNLSVVVSALATPFSLKFDGKIVFLEDVDEALYRVDRMVSQLLIGDALLGARGVVLGDFLNCKDRVAQVLVKRPRGKAKPKSSDFAQLRKPMADLAGLKMVFERVSDVLGIPVAYGLPVGHGPGHAPLPLGSRCRLGKDGRFEMLEWDWLRR